MNHTIAEPSAAAAPPASNGHPLSRLVFAGAGSAPTNVSDLESFRTWAKSGAMPDRGRFAYLDGDLWMDLGTEQIFTHGQVKLQITMVLGMLVASLRLGYFFPDRTLWTHPAVGLSTEPDAMFAFWDTLRQGRLRLVPGMETGFLEVEGTPDLVVEIISESSIRKDRVTLPELYWRAGVPEYWLIDARGAAPELAILAPAAQGYEEAPSADGWVVSAVFGKRFRLEQQPDPLGNPAYQLAYE